MQAKYYLCFILIFSTTIMLSISFCSWKRRRVTAALSLSLSMLAASFYSFGYAMILISMSYEQAIFWFRFQAIGIPFMSVFWLILAIQYTDSGKYLKKQVYAALFVVPVITVAAIYTNDIYQLMYSNMTVSYEGQFTIMKYSTGGPWLWVHFAYTYLTIAAGIVLMIAMYIRSLPVIRRQIIVMLLGASTPWISNILYLAKVGNYDIDFAPFGLVISGILFSWGIFRFNLLKLTPVALEKVFGIMKDGIVIFDFDNNIVNYNDSVKKIVHELEGVKNEKNDYRHIFQNYPEVLDLLDGRGKNSSQLCINEKGNPKYYNVSLSTIYGNSKDTLGRILVFSDITEDMELMTKLDKLASIDELTQLYNRRCFYEKCKAEIERAQRYNHPLSFIIFDIDYFKRINDTYGHHTGDLVLKHIADICRENLRQTDICARYGGEEFAVLTPETKYEEAIQTAERLRLAIYNTPAEINNLNIEINASFGVCGFEPEVNESLHDLMIKADRALYRAKSQGRNRVVLYQ